MKTNTLTPELLYKMDAYWRAANYLSVGQIYLYDNPLLKRPLMLADVKHLLLGHWGTTPGQNFIGKDGSALCPCIGLLGRALGARSGVRQGKDYRPPVQSCHGSNDRLSKGSWHSGDANEHIGLERLYSFEQVRHWCMIMCKVKFVLR
jgi:hypothetical protein